jgi:4-oxalocrotonate tautomerase
MPVIHVSILEGRSVDAKRAYIKALTESSVTHLGCRPENVTIVISEMPFEHYGKGGKMKLDELIEEGITLEEYHAREAKAVGQKK